jgi:predicted metalloprotease
MSTAAAPRSRNRARPLVVAIVVLVTVALGSVALAWSRSDGELLESTRALLDRLGRAAPSDTGGTSVFITDIPASDREGWVTFVADDIQDTWTEIFTEAGMQYPRTGVQLFNGQVESACGTATSDDGPFYCPADQQVYLDLTFFDDMEDVLGAPGDFARAYVIAHEFGHHVQDAVGVTAEVAAASQQRPSLANAFSVRTELQADCLAGVWGYSALHQSQLEPGDLEEAMNAAAAVGDDRLQRQATGSVNPDTFTHGTSTQRAAWFLAGFRSGDPSLCDTFVREMPAESSPSGPGGAGSAGA